jgi:hypothetical protein
VDDVTLLKLAYRSRPGTVDELAAIACLEPHTVEAAIARLHADGALTWVDGGLSYPPPSSWTAEAVMREVDRLRETSAAALDRIDAIVAGLPDILRHWSAGDGPAELLPVEARHGPQAAEDLWYAVTRDVHGRAEAVFPDISRFLETDPERSARFAHAFGAKDSVRAILPASPLAEPELASRAARYADFGVEFRMMVDPPSWFWIDDDSVALPFQWGEGWPSGVFAVRSPAVAGLARSLFEMLWRRAQPLVATERSWTPLLRQMRQGATLDTASRNLGINPRTGRRRIAAAMEHYGVSTLFALGTAWSADDEGASP